MLVLVRDKTAGTAVLGRLFLGSTFICFTLENAAKVIPAGLYKLSNSQSPKFKRELPLVYNDKVPATRGIRIHVGNSAKDSNGCILVGMGQNYALPPAEPALLESKAAETMVTMLCRNTRELAIVQ